MNLKRSGGVLAALAMGCATAYASGGAEAGGGGLTHKMTMLAIQVGVILFAARLGGMLAERLRMPGVLGELFAGILIGPHALGGLGTGAGTFFAGGVFPVPEGAASFPVSPELYGFCTIASIILLFISGVETDMKMFLRYSFAGSLVGVGGVAVSFMLGDLCAVYLMPKIFTGMAPLTFMSPEALFLGIMGTATSVGITARILSEQKRIDSEEGVTTMAGAVIDDVLGIIVLAIGLGVIEAQGKSGGAGAGMDWAHIGGIAAKAFGIWLGATALGVLAARKISFLLKAFRSPTPIAVMSLGLALLLSGFFESQGLAMIIGAYVMGLALSRTDIRYVIQENLAPVYAFMVPLFFCVMGMMVDCKAVFTREVLLFGTAYTALCILAKVAGCAAPALACGFNLRGALRIGAGMVPRGEVALIVAGIGLARGILSPSVFGVGIFMTLVTTVVAPPFLVALFKNPKSGLKHPKSDSQRSRPFTFAMPNAESAVLLCERLIRAFRNEGFFTHRLSSDSSLWQVRRDDVEIGIRRSGAEINFECTPDEEPFIATAIMDVTAGLAALAADLAKPVRTSGIADMINESRVGAHKPSEEIARIVRRFEVVSSLRATDRDGVFKEMLSLLEFKGLIPAGQSAFEELRRRESLMSTGLEQGIAIPHIKMDSIGGIVGAVAVARDGIMDYPTLDGSVVRIIVLILAPASGTSHYLGLVSHISNSLNESGRAAVLDAKSESAVRAVFLGEDAPRAAAHAVSRGG